ncbi:DNA-binding transcriptional regulator [Vibrio sp. ABG19]|uniref:XylR family transcriptional regulator n=1 Tax=Vibrio sp. ABG19 TaxID=2817385 RepID=UPI00249F047B|nr:DNA-binding transcriptional regulator [Vibrio sp. ABG19]WGY47139.1 DNA-binding transcriptional regulator [Vibrio sp. ABG19]
MDKNYRISLLFNANKVYDRQIMEGIGEYLHASQTHWDIFVEEDFTTNIDHFRAWRGDGVIADFDNPAIESLLKDSGIPVVGIGGSYKDEQQYPDVPYVATDNCALVEMAFNHLRDKGIEKFAFYGIPHESWERWASERESAFVNLATQNDYFHSVYRGNKTNPLSWQYDMNRLADWLQRLPNPIGIIAVTDARARHILQACDSLGLMVPDRIAVVGIDNEEMTRYLTRVSLSSVGQGCKSMGYTAAKMLHRLLNKKEQGEPLTINPARVLIPPTKVFERESSDFQALNDPYVIQALHFIRHNACRGIKVEQVLHHVGISRSNLEARFRQERGYSIHNEIHEAKLERAKSLLISTELPIAEIAQACGYPSLQYMYSVFKKAFAKTPKEYRLSGSEENN